MFKRPPSTKTTTPLRSSSRRQLIAHLNALYPILASCPPAVLAQVFPEQIRHGGATTTAGHKIVVYSDNAGKPIWWEAGNDAGGWMNSKAGQSSSSQPPEIMPTMVALWVVPNLLPILPTWPQVIEPALLSGSALMVPGLIPPPNTYMGSALFPSPPGNNQLVAIVGYPDNVPMVLARTEMDISTAAGLRSRGEKGKAAKVLHCAGDGLCQLGGKALQPPETVQPVEISTSETDDVAAADSQPNGDNDAHHTEDRADGQQATHLESGVDDIDLSAQTSPTKQFEPSEVDAMLYLALLSAVHDLHCNKTATEVLPLTVSAFYSTYVLPNRPAHWPPQPARGKKGKQAKNKGRPGTYGGLFDAAVENASTEGEPVAISTDQAVVAKSSAKKLGKWLKGALGSKGEPLLKIKSSKGDDTVVAIFDGHEDIQGLAPFCTMADHQKASLPKTELSSNALDSKTTTVSSSRSSASAPDTFVHLELLYQPQNLVIPFLADALHLSIRKGGYYSAAELRNAMTNYIVAECKPVPHNQALVVPSEELTSLLDVKNANRGIKREQLHSLFQSTKCFKILVRLHRLSGINLSRLQSSPVPSTELDDSLQLDENEHSSKVQPVPKAPSASSSGQSATAWQPVRIITKKRQGNKVVTLVTGLETVIVDAKVWAGEVMKGLGTSTSVSALSSSTPKQPASEVMIQGDQRHFIVEKLAKENGVSRALIDVDLPRGGKGKN